MLKILTLIFSLITLAHADILLIGDSHTVGPFGDTLHRILAKDHPDKMIMVYAHSSSAPVHWMSKKPIKLTGGLNHHMSFNNLYLNHPNQPHWRIPQNSLNLQTLLGNPVMHESWRLKIPSKPNLDTIIFALGANDEEAVISEAGYTRRIQILDQMLQEITDVGLKCIWIGPPSSIKSTDAREEKTHRYLIEGIKERCPFFDSRKFKARFCDKVHFNCGPAIPMANEWARETAEFINGNI